MTTAALFTLSLMLVAPGQCSRMKPVQQANMEQLQVEAVQDNSTTEGVPTPAVAYSWGDQGELSNYCPAGTGVDSKAECEAAAASLGHNQVTVNFEDRYGHIAAGCWAQRGQLIWNLGGCDSCKSSSYTQLCRTQVQEGDENGQGSDDEFNSAVWLDNLVLRGFSQSWRKKDWNSAAAYCADSGLRLATVDSTDKLDALISVLGVHFHIGLGRASTAEEFTWDDGTPTNDWIKMGNTASKDCTGNPFCWAGNKQCTGIYNGQTHGIACEGAYVWKFACEEGAPTPAPTPGAKEDKQVEQASGEETTAPQKSGALHIAPCVTSALAATVAYMHIY